MTNNNSIQIPTNANPDVLENTLTQDITTLEAIYDLIDNSIDAARRDIFTNKNFTADDYGMPRDYSGYSIDVVVNDKEISIVDNCLGFSKEELENKSLTLGQSSNHEFGIGQYGIGLKRSLLKIGNKYTLNTDDEKHRFKVNFTNKDFNSEKGFISSSILKSNNRKMTSLKINNLKQAILPDIKSEIWYENAIEGMNQRYTIYLEKGLRISIKYFENKPKEIKSSLVKLRHDSKFKSFKRSYKLNKDVTVIISAGIHSKYKFKGELDYSVSENRKITNEYGIYIICNDRVIVASSKEKMHGWKTNWHSEYNGFICIVRFISQNPSLLPINTAKTAIQADSAIFLKAASKIQPIADDYRKNIRFRYSSGNEEIQLGKGLCDGDDVNAEEEKNKDIKFNNIEHLVKEKDNGAETKKNDAHTIDVNKSELPELEEQTDNTVKTRKKTIKDPDDRKYIFTNSFSFHSSNPVLISIYHELKKTKVDEFPLSCALVTRSLMEYISKIFVKKVNGNLPNDNKFDNILNSIDKYFERNQDLLSQPESAALKCLINLKVDKSLALSPAFLGLNAHAGAYPRPRELKINWVNIEAIMQYMLNNIE